MTPLIAPSAVRELPLLILPDSQEMPRKRWTREDFRRLRDQGFLSLDKHYELIEGEIIEKMSQGRRHILICMRVLKILAQIFGFDYLQSQSSLLLGPFNEPEPDMVVLDKTLDQYLDEEPGPQNVRLMIEVAVSTLLTDRSVKSLLYARAGVQEYWIININDRVLEIFRKPSAEGYRETYQLTENQSVTPLAATQASIRVADLLP